MESSDGQYRALIYYITTQKGLIILEKSHFWLQLTRFCGNSPAKSAHQNPTDPIYQIKVMFWRLGKLILFFDCGTKKWLKLPFVSLVNFSKSRYPYKGRFTLKNGQNQGFFFRTWKFTIFPKKIIYGSWGYLQQPRSHVGQDLGLLGPEK